MGEVVGMMIFRMILVLLVRNDWFIFLIEVGVLCMVLVVFRMIIGIVMMQMMNILEVKLILQVMMRSGISVVRGVVCMIMKIGENNQLKWLFNLIQRFKLMLRKVEIVILMISGCRVFRQVWQRVLLLVIWVRVVIDLKKVGNVQLIGIMLVICQVLKRIIVDRILSQREWCIMDCSFLFLEEMLDCWSNIGGL